MKACLACVFLAFSFLSACDAAPAGEPTPGPTEPNQLEVADQVITTTPPKVKVTAVVDVVPRYIVLRDAAGTVLGSERVWELGPRVYPVSIAIARGGDEVPVTAGLYAADGTQPDLAQPVLDTRGAAVAATFKVLFPADNKLEVVDQTLVSWGYKVKIARADFDELPAFVAVYEDDDGAPGALLGSLAITSAPKLAFNVDLVRFVAPQETLWVVGHADRAPVGTLGAEDPILRDLDGALLSLPIAVTNTSCEGLQTKFCDPAQPGVIRWRDRCDQVSNVTTPCGDGARCDDTGPYVACKPVPDPCAGIGGTVCVAEDPGATWFEDACGAPLRVASRCGATSTCVDGGASATCKLSDTCNGNTTRVCDPSDPSKVFWLDRCGQRNGNSIACGAAASCDDTGGEAVCATTPSCAGNVALVCNPADLSNLYWRDRCDALSGATIPCGAGRECREVEGEATCIDPSPCVGPGEMFCDPAEPGVIKWRGPCGNVLASEIPCGVGTACSEAGGTPRCVSTDLCGGNTSTTCLDSDPGHVYWVDGCGVLTGSTYPCGVATCEVQSGGAGGAACKIIGTCADEKLRVCDPEDPTRVLLTNACGDDLGVFSQCANGKRCVEATPGEAQCACVPTEETRCFGKHFLYEPSGVRGVDSCGNWSGPVLTECALGQICHESEAGPVCTTSLSNASSPMAHRGCSFIDFVTYKTDLDVDCRCRRHAATPNDIAVYNDGGNLACVPQADSWALGWTMGAGPHFRHMLFSQNGGGAYSATHGELFAVKHFTDPSYEGAGLVVGYDIRTGARRIVSGRFPEPSGGYTMFGSGYESVRAVGVLRHEATTLPGAWDLELGGDGKLYVWGSRAGNNEITRVDPVTGARTLVWRQLLEGEAVAPAFGQCFSTRPKTTFVGGFIPVELEDHAFAMGPDGSFYLGFRNATAEGNGIVRIAPDGATCTVVSRWNGTMGQVGAGATPQYSNLEGFFVRNGQLFATLQIGKLLLSIDIMSGQRAVIANPAGSVDSTPGQSTMFWDASRDLLITAGGVQSYLAVAVQLGTGKRQALFLTAPGQLIESAPPWETGAHGAIDNGNYMGYGALAMDPDDNDHLYLVVKWGLIKYEMSTGNSYVMSQ